MERIFGYTAHLVLEDDDGNEFEVARPFKKAKMPDVLALDLSRVLDAVAERKLGTTKRPVY